MKRFKRQRLHLKSVGICIILFGGLAGCASRSSRDILDEKQDRGRPRAAAYAADGFTLDHRSPEERPFRAWQFYYKHCSLVTRNPFPSRDEYNCSDPF